GPGPDRSCVRTNPFPNRVHSSYEHYVSTRTSQVQPRTQQTRYVIGALVRQRFRGNSHFVYATFVEAEIEHVLARHAVAFNDHLPDASIRLSLVDLFFKCFTG